MAYPRVYPVNPQRSRFGFMGAETPTGTPGTTLIDKPKTAMIPRVPGTYTVDKAGNVKFTVEPKGEKTNYMPWIFGGLAAVGFLAMLASSKKKKRAY